MIIIMNMYSYAHTKLCKLLKCKKKLTEFVKLQKTTFHDQSPTEES